MTALLRRHLTAEVTHEIGFPGGKLLAEVGAAVDDPGTERPNGGLERVETTPGVRATPLLLGV